MMEQNQLPPILPMKKNVLCRNMQARLQDNSCSLFTNNLHHLMFTILLLQSALVYIDVRCAKRFRLKLFARSMLLSYITMLALLLSQNIFLSRLFWIPLLCYAMFSTLMHWHLRRWFINNKTNK